MGAVQGSQSPRLAPVVAVFTTEAQSHGETLNLQDPVSVRFCQAVGFLWVSVSPCLRGENPNWATTLASAATSKLWFASIMRHLGLQAAS